MRLRRLTTKHGSKKDKRAVHGNPFCNQETLCDISGHRSAIDQRCSTHQTSERPSDGQSGEVAGSGGTDMPENPETQADEKDDFLTATSTSMRSSPRFN